MSVYKVRMVTIHAERGFVKKQNIREVIEGILAKAAELLDQWKSRTGIEVEGARLTLPDTRPDELPGLLERMGDGWRDDGYIVSVGHIPAETKTLAQLLEDVASRGLYAAVDLRTLDPRLALHVAKALIHLSRNPVNATRIGVSLGAPPLTPYYPLSWSPGNARKATVALTFPNYLRNAYQSGGLQGLEEAVDDAARMGLSALDYVAAKLEAAPTGIDLSVSPWMDESSLSLVETVAGVEIDQPGIAAGIRVVEEAILNKALATGRAVGFNMVQLPVAEDTLMKQRAAQGRLTATSLARLSGVCLAGLDLVVVPRDEKKVAGLLLEVASYARSKGATLGVRLVSVDAEVGDTVDLGVFGKVAVIPF